MLKRELGQRTGNCRVRDKHGKRKMGAGEGKREALPQTLAKEMRFQSECTPTFTVLGESRLKYSAKKEHHTLQ